MISGPAAIWLQGHRDDLNMRVRLARHRGGRPDSVLLSAWLEYLLPTLSARNASDGLLLATFDLTLRLASQGRLPAPGQATSNAQGLLLAILPELVPALSATPALLAAFSNAANNLGDTGTTFVRCLPALAMSGPAETLSRAGAVLAWRLGETRLRGQALTIAASLPAAVVAVALGIPATLVPAALAGLNSNAWRRPGLARQIGAVLGNIGDFTGYGGAFSAPPRLLSSSRGHSLRVDCGGTIHRLETDAFGCRCLPERGDSGTPSMPMVPRLTTPYLNGADTWVLLPSVEKPQVLAHTRPDSFRIRIIDLESV